MWGIRYKYPPPVASIRVSSAMRKGAHASIGPNVIHPLFGLGFGVSCCQYLQHFFIPLIFPKICSRSKTGISDLVKSMGAARWIGLDLG
jgi:hypothetical protein